MNMEQLRERISDLAMQVARIEVRLDDHIEQCRRDRQRGEFQRLRAVVDAAIALVARHNEDWPDIETDTRTDTTWDDLVAAVAAMRRETDR